METIKYFRGEYEWLSNFYFSTMVIDNKTYSTNEHFFQASKAIYDDDHELIRCCRLPSEAKKLGRKIVLRPNWEQIKDAIMLVGVKAKFFQNKDLAEKLIATGNTILIEGNYWKDMYWGVYDGKGKNKLGHILMYVRSLLI